MTNEMKRQIVQEGLDRRAAERRDAALEAQARKLRIIINDNHTAKTSYNPPAQRTARPQAEPEKATHEESHRNEEEAERDAEAAYCNGWYRFMLRTFTPTLIAAATLRMAVNGILPAPLAIPCAIVAGLVSIETFAARFLHERW